MYKCFTLIFIPVGALKIKTKVAIRLLVISTGVQSNIEMNCTFNLLCSTPHTYVMNCIPLLVIKKIYNVRTVLGSTKYAIINNLLCGTLI